MVNLVMGLTGSPGVIGFNLVYARLAGDVKAGLFLGQCVFWSDKSIMDGGWFWKKYEDWQAETCLSKREIRRAAKLASRWVETRVKKAFGYPTVHYRVRLDLLEADIRKLLGNGRAQESAGTALSESDQLLLSENDRSLLSENDQSLLSESDPTRQTDAESYERSLSESHPTALSESNETSLSIVTERDNGKCRSVTIDSDRTQRTLTEITAETTSENTTEQEGAAEIIVEPAGAIAATSSPASSAGPGPEQAAGRIESTQETARPARSRADPRTNSPAIRLFRRVTGFLPPKSNYDRVMRIFGENPDPADEAWARECFATWTGKGHKPINLDWLLDWYTHGIREKRGNTEWRRQRPALEEPEEEPADADEELPPPEPEKEPVAEIPEKAAEIWVRALRLIRAQMVQATYDNWVKSTRGESYDGTAFRVWAPSGYAQDWLANRLHKTIRRTLVEILGPQIEVHYVRSDGPEICPDHRQETNP